MHCIFDHSLKELYSLDFFSINGCSEEKGGNIGPFSARDECLEGRGMFSLSRKALRDTGNKKEQNALMTAHPLCVCS